MPTDLFRIVGTTVVGAFHVESVVAEGGFAVVYRAYHEGFRANVALKCLKIPAHLPPAARERFADQFRSEAELLFKLSSTIPAIVRPLHVESVFAPNGVFMPFLALEWLEGETLEAFAEKRRAAGKPLELPELVTLLTPVARALERAHSFPSGKGRVAVVHRDLKPENIFLARVAGEDVVKILDFGISAVMELARTGEPDARGDVPRPGSFTPAFASPEQWAPEQFGETGPWTDVWGLALTMSEILCGRSVFEGERDEVKQLATRDGTPRTPGALGVPVSPAVERVFRKALALSPRERFAGAGELWDSLVAAMGSPRSSTRSAPSFAEFEPPDEPGVAIELGGDPMPAPAPKQAPLAPPAPAASGPASAKPKGSPSAEPPPPATTRAPMSPAVIPVALLGVGFAFGAVNWAYAGSTGQTLAVGPVPAAWISAALVLAGLSSAVYRWVSLNS